ncbi:MAG: T9SS type A sorting domain-containing protein, partial [Bdellovibrionales bacterium]
YMEIACGTLGISDIDNLANMSFYPNPVIDFVTINVDKNLIGSTYIITDLLGKQVLTGKLNNETSSIDISQLNSGIYLFQVGQQMKQTLKLRKE